MKKGVSGRYWMQFHLYLEESEIGGQGWEAEAGIFPFLVVKVEEGE